MMKKILVALIVCSLLIIPQLSKAQEDCTTVECLHVYNDYIYGQSYTTWAGLYAMENQPLIQNWHNTAFGHSAMKNIVGTQSPLTGIKNSAFGSNALKGLNIGVNGGVYNTAIGSSALMRIDDGEFNTAVGASTMSGNTTGFFNVAVGVETLRGNAAVQTGNYNTVLGTYSLSENSTGSRNTVVGTFAGYLAPDHATGWYDRPHLTEPVRGNNNQTGNDNIYIGYKSGSASTDINSSIAIGTDAIVTDHNQLVVGSNYSDSSKGLITDSYWGSGVTSDVPQPFSFHATGGLGDDIAGADLIIAGGKSTGDAKGGTIRFQFSPGWVGGGSSDPNPLTDILIVAKSWDNSVDIIGDNLTVGSKNGDPGTREPNQIKSARFLMPTYEYTDDSDRFTIIYGRGTDTYNRISVGGGTGDADSATQVIFHTAPNLGAPGLERMRIDENGNVGIGTSTPTEKLTVAGTIESTIGGIKFPDSTIMISANNVTGDFSSTGSFDATGEYQIDSITVLQAETSNTYLGKNAGYSATGIGNVFLGYQAGYNEAGNSKLYIANSSTAAPLIYGEFDNGIVDINGDLYITGNTYMDSDENLKEDIRPIESSLQKVLDIKGVSYKWKKQKNQSGRITDKRHYGVIAQDVEDVLPEIVRKGENGNKKVAYMELIPVLIEAVKEQQKTITELSVKVQNLEKELKMKDTMAMVELNPR